MSENETPYMAGGTGRAGDDHVVPFHVAPLEVRGRAVQLGPMLSSILDRHAYPEPVSRLLGEVIVLTVLLGTSLKFTGRFTVQTQTDGPVSLLVVDFKTPGDVRAYASFDSEAVARMAAREAFRPKDLLGNGVLAMTIDQGAHMQRYQGIVELAGASLEEVAHAYFRQSEQIPTCVCLAVSRLVTPAPQGGGSSATWRGGGLLIQFLPDTPGRLPVRDLPGGDDPNADSLHDDGESDESWVEARMLAETISDDELTDPQIGSERLLYRLFHEHGVHVHEPGTVEDRCSCSRGRILEVLKSMPEPEIEASWQDGVISMSCEFCSTTYRIVPADLED